jgi:hypothetical protein
VTLKPERADVAGSFYRAPVAPKTSQNGLRQLSERCGFRPPTLGRRGVVGDAEVDQTHEVVSGHQRVGRLDVAVDQSVLVRRNRSRYPGVAPI